MSLVVRRVPGTWAVARLDAAEGWPWWATPSELFSSVTRTPHETSVVCEASLVPEGVRAERGFALYSVDGPIPFDAVGVLASLVQPLAREGISVFSISTFDTDHILVSRANAARSEASWRASGHEVLGG